ncbi:hypothetical protein AB0F96_09380 [Streptomyces sp. NPDC023998]|uniref:hypothetical protein n=1 Tax=Streptomyces sp. NPDC023998 TaxID=3154597 RepID=UPI0033FF6D60
MPDSHDRPTQRLRRPGRPATPHVPADDDGPEYLATGWSLGSDDSAAPRNDVLPTAATLWKTGLYPSSPPGTAGEAPTVPLTDQGQANGTVTAVWRGGPAAVPLRRRRKGVRIRRWVLPILLAAAVTAVLLWLRIPPEQAVTEVSEVTVRAEPAELGCDGTAEVVATARTNGAPGVIRYRWLRSDGTVSGELTQSVSARQQEARLVLRWTFNGRGTQRAGAVVDILSPTPHTASAGFTYRCP